MDYVPFSYVEGFINNCGMDHTKVISFTVMQEGINWHVAEEQQKVRIEFQPIKYEPPPVSGGISYEMTVQETMGTGSTAGEVVSHD